MKDSSGAVLPGVTIEARSPRLVGVESTVSDANGIFRFPALPTGAYVVTASLQGFGPAKVENIRLELGQVLKVDLTMTVAAMAESIQVKAEAPLIDVKQNTSALSIQSDLIDRLPKGRTANELLNSAPGTQNEGRGGGTMVDGASGSENRFLVDGLDTTDLRTGTSRKGVLVDFLQELQVKSSGYNAEYRAATGGVISAITKSGGNNFHGSVGAYYSDADWLGDVRRSLRLNPSNTTLAEYTATPRDPRRTVEPVVDFGGPILNDRFWFYGGYSPELVRTSRTVTFRSNQQQLTMDNPTTEHNLYWNVTGQISRNLRMRISGINERDKGGLTTLPNKEPDGTSTSNFALFNPPSMLRTDAYNDLFSTDFDWVASPSTYMNVKAGFLRYGSYNAGQEPFLGTRRTFSNSNVNLAGVPSNLQQISGFADNPTNSWNEGDRYTRWNISGDVTKFFTWKGQHSLKAGLQFERLGNSVDSGQQGQNIALSWNSSHTTLTNQIVRGQFGFYTVSRNFTGGNIHSNNLGVYLQDSWTLSDRFTINPGIRIEREEVPSYRPENPGIEFGWGDKIAPRLGFAWDIAGDGKWKAFGSWGMFYDVFKLELPRGSFGAENWIQYHWTLDTPNWPSIDCDGLPNSGCPGTFIEQIDRRHTSNEPGNSTVDPDLKPVRAQEAVFGLDRELTRNMSFGVRYSHKWLDRTIEDVGVAVPGIGEVFYISNPGEGIATFILGPNFPAQPKPKRVYDGVELRLRKRLSNRWSLNSALTISRLFGNYAGLASSDENGRTSPNVNRVFDGLYMNYDERGELVYGRLQTDRPLQFELQGTYELPWGTGVGMNYYAGSGTPLQSQATIQLVPVFYKGRGNLGRTPTLQQTDMTLWHAFNIGGGRNVSLQINVMNLFDSDTATNFHTSPYRDALPVSPTQFFQGFDAEAIANATPSVRKDARLLMPNAFQGAREIRLMAKFTF